MRRVHAPILLLFTLLGAPFAFGATAGAQDEVSLQVEKKARLRADGGVVFTVRATCGPLPGVADFREGLAGATQAKTGAQAEGGLSPDVVCDGVERVYTASLSAFTPETFANGKASATASIRACNTVGDQQVCVQGTDRRSIVISGSERP